MCATSLQRLGHQHPVFAALMSTTTPASIRLIGRLQHAALGVLRALRDPPLDETGPLGESLGIPEALYEFAAQSIPRAAALPEGKLDLASAYFTAVAAGLGEENALTWEALCAECPRCICGLLAASEAVRNANAELSGAKCTVDAAQLVPEFAVISRAAAAYCLAVRACPANRLDGTGPPCAKRAEHDPDAPFEERVPAPVLAHRDGGMDFVRVRHLAWERERALARFANVPREWTRSVKPPPWLSVSACGAPGPPSTRRARIPRGRARRR